MLLHIYLITWSQILEDRNLNKVNQPIVPMDEISLIKVQKW